MDPVKEPACVVCGATANVWGGPGSWVCADGNGCLARAAARRPKPQVVYVEPDYAALGYPETEVRTTPYSFQTLVAQVLSWWR